MPLFDSTTDRKPLSVSEVTRDIKSLLEDSFSSLCVEGEISGFRPQSSGHLYFSLKDDSAVLPAVMWRSTAMRLRFAFQNGLSVIAFGRLSVYEPHGKYQFTVDRLMPQGEGPLELAFRQLKEKLFSKGYFDPRRKKPIPKVPRRIGIVTSPTGAAIRDMLETLSRRWPAAEVVLTPVRVQGAGAAEEIAAAIESLNALHANGQMLFDVVIVGRGGGSLEDLWAFNEEVVADAIFASRLPIVSGVGHETDLTIADLVADVRAVTPTAAAALIVPDRFELLESVNGVAARLRGGLLRRVERARQRLDDLAARRPFRFPLERVHNLSRRLDELAERLTRRQPLQRAREIGDRLGVLKDRLDQSMQRILDRCRERTGSIAGRLEALSPLNVLARGYSITSGPGDVLLRSTDTVRPGDRLVTRLRRGRIVSRVESVEFEPPPGVSRE